MGKADSGGGPGRFRDIRSLRNHWSRPAGRRAYYWYLTFEDAPALHALARRCQEAIAFPYYDLTPPTDLHLTLDRIAFEDDITHEQLDAIAAAAISACREVPAFGITLGGLGGTPGAIGFSAYPAQPIGGLRETLRAATLSVVPDAPVQGPEFDPHVAIAYANSDGVPAAQAIAAVRELKAAARAEVTIKEGVLVLLERRPRSYAWRAVSRVPLAR